MTLSISPIYAALLTLLFIALSVRVIGARRQANVGFGDGGHSGLMRRQRVHGNFVEYVPLGLILMVCAELQGDSDITLHLIGGTLLAGRLIHAYGVSQDPETVKIRVYGMLLTFAALVIGAGANLGIGSLVNGLVGA